MSESVNICIIVGNGFDLAAGLGTTTKDFVARYAVKHDNADTPAGRLAARIQEEGPENWADFERKLGEYAAELDPVVPDADIVDEYVAAKAAIEQELVDFIAEKEALIDPDWVEKTAGECFDSICCWLNALTPRDRQRILGDFSSPYSFDVNFVTLNYTSLLDQMVRLRGKNAIASSESYVEGYRIRDIVHAHGDLRGNPICGVDQPSQIHSELISADESAIETVVKSSTQQMLDSLDDAKARDLINSAGVILVYGCSLGVTDARWWKAVVDRLKDSSTKRFVVLFSYGFERSGSTAAVVRSRMNRLKEKLCESAGYSKDDLKAQLIDRIFILSSDAIFKMPEPLAVGAPETNERN